MRREKTLQKQTDEKKSLNRTVADLKASTMNLRLSNERTINLQVKEKGLLSSIENLKRIESEYILKSAKAKDDFLKSEKEYAKKISDFRKELIVPPELVREKEDITQNILEAKNELISVSSQSRERIESLKADEEKLGIEISKKRKIIETLNKDFSVLSGKNDSLNKQVFSQEGLLAQRESTLSRLDSSISTKKREEIDLEERISTLKKEVSELSVLNREKEGELTKLEKEIKAVKDDLENRTISIISLAKREASVKTEEAKLKKFAQKLGIPLNF